MPPGLLALMWVLALNFYFREADVAVVTTQRPTTAEAFHLPVPVPPLSHAVAAFV